MSRNHDLERSTNARPGGREKDQPSIGLLESRSRADASIWSCAHPRSRQEVDQWQWQMSSRRQWTSHVHRL
jgi:hypothetical protein